jgi:hypothetical protein
METRFEQERDDFEFYLLDTCNYSKKVAIDCLSRCRRIETHITNDLSESVSSEQEFNNLIIQIQQYSSSKCEQKKSEYTLAGSLRAAAKKYALYLFPQKALNYPKGYGKNKNR